MTTPDEPTEPTPEPPPEEPTPAPEPPPRPVKINVLCATCNTRGRLTDSGWKHVTESEDDPHDFVPKQAGTTGG